VAEVIENVDLTGSGLRSNNIMGLRHIPRFIYFSGMIDLSLNRYFLMLHLLWQSSLSSHLRCHDWGPRWLHLVPGVLGRLERYFDLHYLNVVLFIVACMGANQHLLMRVVRALRPKQTYRLDENKFS
jgi:hypothetical protein